ncbi:ead/Ea22-like family protein [Enterobacter roggenkampii]|uniref:ead/Ea22-like family protein n=1 Tax=Enterobacter roggenkampii TaxID=1812935 RepID=UPI002006D466|nr:ead/Ea22-like family protein [Enterobacter roggenkampii]MCK7230944.1 ead/Ea22-like family protein [Enterobacter roggenkampii]
MSNIDKRALREAAEKALNAQARLALMESVFDDDGDDVKPEAQEDISICVSFNDLTNPATALALLDELEAKDKRIAELEAREINLPPYSFFDFKQGSPFKSGAYCHIDSVNQELSKHGIKMTAAAGKGE